MVIYELTSGPSQWSLQTSDDCFIVSRTVGEWNVSVLCAHGAGLLIAAAASSLTVTLSFSLITHSAMSSPSSDAPLLFHVECSRSFCLSTRGQLQTRTFLIF